MRTVVLLVVALAVAHVAALSLGADGESKLPVPEQAAQEQALALVRDIYKDEFAAAKQPKDKAQLAKRLLEEGSATTGDPAGKYVLLTEARRLAVEANEVSQTMTVIDALTGNFAIDELPMKAESLETFTKTAGTPARAKEIAEIARALIDEAIRRDVFAGAEQLSKIGAAAAKKAKQAGLIKQFAAQGRQVAELRTAYDAAKAALAKLEQEPADADANLEAGKYACFLKRDWESGLPMLALGSDERLRTLALAELAPTEDEQKQLELGDGWWEAADALEGKQQVTVRAHAGSFYEQALPKLAGLSKAKAAKRVEQVQKEAPTDVVASRSEGVEPKRKAAPEVTNSIGMQLRLIPSGNFVMGSQETERNRRSNETPHAVILTQAFYIGVCEVTQEQYWRVMGKNPSQFKEPQLPVVNVSWDDAAEFCEQLSALKKEKLAKRVYRLPTEAQWEYACRAGTETAYCFGNDPAQLTDFAWFDKNSGPALRLVRQKSPNAWGLYDMHGNVWEWCRDWQGNYPSGVVTDPLGPSDGSAHVYRGSAWDSSDWTCRSAHRDGNVPSFRRNSLGFRVVCDVAGMKRAGLQPERPSDSVSAGSGGNQPDRRASSKSSARYKPIKTIKLGDGRTLDVYDLLSPPTDEVFKSLFPDPVAIQKSSTGQVTAGFAYHKKEIHGGLAIFADDKRLEVLGQYLEGDRNGIFRTTNEKKERRYLAEFKRGKKVNLAFLFENDLPTYLEEWEKGQRARQWLVSHENDEAVGRLAGDLDDTQQARLDQLAQEMDAIERQIKEREIAVKQWWPNEYKRMQQEIIAEKSVAARDRIIARHQQASRENAAKFGGLLKAGLGRGGL